MVIWRDSKDFEKHKNEFYGRRITMPKIKTHKGAAKRFGVTKNGKIKRGKAFRSHILNKKTTKRKRKLRKMGYLSAANAATIKKMIPYK